MSKKAHTAAQDTTDNEERNPGIEKDGENE
jgi:hypothetical protein